MAFDTIVYKDCILSEDGKRLLKVLSAVKNFRIPKTVEEIATNAFAKSQVQQVEIPNSVVTIFMRAFAWCKHLEIVKINTRESKLKVIGRLCFQRCTNLRSIDLPQSVERIGKRHAFLIILPFYVL